MISDNSYRGPFVSDEDDDEYEVEEEASSTNSDEEDDATEFVEVVEDSMDVVTQIPSPPSMTSQLWCQAPLTPISFKSWSPNTEFACSPIFSRRIT